MIMDKLTFAPRWIFILEGLATIVVAVGAYFFIHNYPDTAEFLSDKERKFIRDRLSSDSDATHDETFSWSNAVKAFKDPKCWLYGVAFHTTSLPLYTFSLFLVSPAPHIPLREWTSDHR
jgi:hypothetical protein